MSQLQPSTFEALILFMKRLDKYKTANGHSFSQGELFLELMDLSSHIEMVGINRGSMDIMRVTSEMKVQNNILNALTNRST